MQHILYISKNQIKSNLRASLELYYDSALSTKWWQLYILYSYS